MFSSIEEIKYLFKDGRLIIVNYNDSVFIEAMSLLDISINDISKDDQFVYKSKKVPAVIWDLYEEYKTESLEVEIDDEMYFVVTPRECVKTEIRRLKFIIGAV